MDKRAVSSNTAQLIKTSLPLRREFAVLLTLVADESPKPDSLINAP